MYDATKDFKPFERSSEAAPGRHPRPRKGATAKKRKRLEMSREARQAAEKAAPAKAPVKKKK